MLLWAWWLRHEPFLTAKQEMLAGSPPLEASRFRHLIGRN